LPPSGGSTLLIDEYFEAGDDRFLAELLASRSDKKLVSLAQRWYWDPRPFGRRMLLAYVDDGCDRANHRPLVKRLFKQAEAAGDDEAMGHFMVAFDRLVRHDLVEKREWDWSSRTSVSRWVLQRDPAVRSRAPKPKKRAAAAVDRFTAHAALLCRRAFRYFRNIGHRDAPRYGRAIRAAPFYKDADLQKPEQLLDAWGLVHVLYHASPILLRSPHGVRLAAGAKLADLSPAPIYPGVWEQGFEELIALLQGASSRTVRRFAIDRLERHHSDALRALSFARLRGLLRSPHEEVQAFGALRLKGAAGLENLPLGDWLELLRSETRRSSLICELVGPTSTGSFSSRRAWSWRARCGGGRGRARLGAVEAVARPRTSGPGVAADAAARTPRRHGMGRPPLGSPLTGRDVRDLIDSNVEARRRAFPHEGRSGPTGAWARSGVPYDDVRTRFVRHLSAWEQALDPAALRRVWATSLLAIHRGGRAKQRVVLQVADRIVKRPEDAEDLLPLLGIALRSVRAPERRAGLAAIARAAFRRPDLRAAIERRLPELRLKGLEVA
jgi:hypothetical protein